MNTNIEGNVVLAFGPQPLDWISKASKICGEDAVMDPDVARMAGANLAAGAPEALAALRKLLAAGALEAASKANPGMSEAAVRWLAHGERGVSSETIFTHLTGVNALGSWRHKIGDVPYDPAEFRRCRLLLEQVPELVPLFPKMAEMSPKWANLIQAWDEICKAMDLESPDWRELGNGQAAPTAYQLIKKAIGR